MFSASSTPFCSVTIVAGPMVKKDSKITCKFTGEKGIFDSHYVNFDLPAPYAYKEGNSVEVCTAGLWTCFLNYISALQ